MIGRPDVEVRLDGQWLRALGYVSDVKWSTRYADGPCGPDLASCTIDLDRRDDSTFLRLGKTFEVYEGGKIRFGGALSEMSRTFPRELHATSWARRNYVATLEPGHRVGYTANNLPFTTADPTQPSWLLDASDLEIGVADEALHTQVVATYVTAVGMNGAEDTTDTVTVDDVSAQSLFGIIPFELDLTPLSVITAQEATDYAQQQLNEFAKPQWLSRATVDTTRLLTKGGMPAHLPDVEAMQMVRLFNIPNNLGGLRSSALALDVILSEVEFSTTDPTSVSIGPQRRVVASIADTVRQAAEAMRIAREAKAAAL